MLYNLRHIELSLNEETVNHMSYNNKLDQLYKAIGKLATYSLEGTIAYDKVTITSDSCYNNTDLLATYTWINAPDVVKQLTIGAIYRKELGDYTYHT